MIETREELKEARRSLGLSITEAADLLRVRPDYLREIETGRRNMTGPITVAMEALIAGWRPDE